MFSYFAGRCSARSWSCPFYATTIATWRSLTIWRPPPLRIQGDLDADRFIVTVNSSVLFSAPDSTERGRVVP